MGEEVKPSDLSGEVGFFDRFAALANGVVSRAPFFVFCVLLVVIWLPSYFLFGSIDTWQLVINTITTIVTFLLVALLQNTSTREGTATQKKLNAIADALADLIEFMATHTDTADDCDHLRRDAEELRAAVGLEHRTTA